MSFEKVDDKPNTIASNILFFGFYEKEKYSERNYEIWNCCQMKFYIFSCIYNKTTLLWHVIFSKDIFKFCDAIKTSKWCKLLHFSEKFAFVASRTITKIFFWKKKLKYFFEDIFISKTNNSKEYRRTTLASTFSWLFDLSCALDFIFSTKIRFFLTFWIGDYNTIFVRSVNKFHFLKSNIIIISCKSGFYT